MTLWPIFVTVFLAELGDKTHLATLLFAADQNTSKVGVFLASAGALVLSSFLVVVIGSQLHLCPASGTQACSWRWVCRHWHLGPSRCESMTIELGLRLKRLYSHLHRAARWETG